MLSGIAQIEKATRAGALMVMTSKKSKANFGNRTIWTGDNLEIMRGMNSESVDLIYLDPPFNSNANYAAPVGSKAAGAAFKDTWTLRDVDVEWINLIENKYPSLYRVILSALTNSDKSYLVYMAVRLLEMERILKKTGSIYLHCDATMSHYLKLAMDCIFGKKNFRNEIVWNYGKVSNSKAKKFLRQHDTILFYTGSSDYFYLPMFDSSISPRKQQLIKSGFNTKNQDGKKYLYIYDEEIVKEKNIDLSKYDVVKHVDTTVGNRFTDVFEIDILNTRSKESMGYPTQKPLALLDRIIQSSSKHGDVVFDPFCGCATTLVSADRLQRQWVGIDISATAVKLVRKRIKVDRGVEEQVFSESINPRTDIPKRTDLGKIPRYNSPKNKEKLYGKQKGYCAGCREHFQDRHLEVDHIISRDKGGTDHFENLQLLCGSCNRVKGNRGMEYLRAHLQLLE